MDYTDGSEEGACAAEAGIASLGRAAGIDFDFHVRTDWQPVDSQRLLLWAGRFGKQEVFMTALNRRHFEQRESASERPTLLAACADAGLDEDAAAAFLNTDELVDHVWRSYGDTIRRHGIHAIPLFIFSHPASGAVGGPFREKPPQRPPPAASVVDAAAGAGTPPSPPPEEPWVANGSMNAEHFFAIFEEMRGRALTTGTAK